MIGGNWGGDAFLCPGVETDDTATGGKPKRSKPPYAGSLSETHTPDSSIGWSTTTDGNLTFGLM